MPYPFHTDDVFYATDANSIIESTLSLTGTAPQTVSSPVNLTGLLRLRSGAVVNAPLVLQNAGYVQLPLNTTTGRPVSPGQGCLHFNTTTDTLEIYDGTVWLTYLPVTSSGVTGTAPGQPLSLVTGTTSTTAVPLTWAAPLTGSIPITYQVQYRAGGSTTWQPWGTPISDQATTVIGLVPGTRYDFQVVAINAFGSTASAITSTTTAYVLPASVIVTAGTVTSTTIAMTWTADTIGTGATSYQPQYRVTGTSSWTTFGTPTNALSITLTGLSAATAYDVSIVATNPGGSTLSTIATATTSAAATVAPNAPTGLMASNITAQSLSLSWTAPTTGSVPFSYNVQFRVHGSTTFSSALVTTATTATIAGLLPATQFDFEVTASNSIGNATTSIINATTLTLTSASTGLSGNQTIGDIVVSPPEIVGPLSGTVVVSGSLAINDIVIFDPSQTGSTLTMTVSCVSGTLAMTSADNSPIPMTGPHIIANFSNTLTSLQAALLTLVYTAPATVQTDTISVKITDSFGNHNTITIPISVTAAQVVPPPGGTIPTDATGTTAQRAAQFANGFGVNLRLDYVQYGYQNLASVENCINYLGCKVLRDTPYTANDSTWLPQVAQATNAKLILYVAQDNSTNYNTYVTHMKTIASQTQNRVLAFEGPDEPDTAQAFDGFTVSYATVNSTQQALYTAAKSYNPPLSVLATAMNDPTHYNLTADETNVSDYANAHIYPPNAPNFNGTNTVGFIQTAMQGAQTETNKPVAITEFAFPTSDPPKAQYFSSNTSAAYALQFMMDAFILGSPYYIWYGLLDDFNGAYGLFTGDLNYTAKRPATAIRNMLAIFASDTNGNATTFAPGKLDYTVTGKPSGPNGSMGYRELLLQDSNGVFYLMMSNEQLLCDNSRNNADVTVANVNVTVRFNSATMTSVKIFDPYAQATAISTSTSVGAGGMTVSLPARPVILQITHP